MKHVYPGTLGIAVIFVLVLALSSNAGQSYLHTDSMSEVAPTTQTIYTPVVPVAPEPTPLVNTPTPGIYTLADVAKHATASDCWTAINGNVYNITPFIPNHPGGDRILAVCGVDGTQAFENQHDGQGRPEAELATLKIGTLAQ